MARVLILEPSAELLHLLERSVLRLGHEPVRPARGGDEPPDADAVLLDPDLDSSAEVAAAFRDRHPDVPMIVCSIYPPSEETRRLRPSRHLLKPFTREELERALDAAVRGPVHAGA